MTGQADGKRRILLVGVAVLVLLCSCAQAKQGVEENSSSLPQESVLAVSEQPGDSSVAVVSSSAIFEEVPYSAPITPFSPYLPASMPPEPYVSVKSLKEIYGDWQYYVDPELIDIWDATFQIRIDENEIMISLGTLYTNSGVFYKGAYTYAGGYIYADIEQMSEDGDTQRFLVKIRVEQSEADDTVTIFTLESDGSAEEDFLRFFELLLDVRTPFVRAEG